MSRITQKKESRATLEAPAVMSSGDLINDEVMNNAGENLGRVEKLMIDLPSGRVLYAVVSYGGLLSTRKYVAVPWQALSFSHHDKRFVLNVTRDRMKEAPVFDPDKWPQQAERGWVSDLYGFYGYPAPSVGQTEFGPREGLPASSLINSTVIDSSGETIGKLKDLFIDLNNSEILFAAMSTGTILGMDNRYYALPTRVLSIKDDKLVVGVTRDRLAKGPSFEKDRWPDVNDPNWTRELHAYYGGDGNMGA